MSIVQALEEVGLRQPTSPAVEWHQAVWTYGDLLQGIAEVKSALASRGLQQGSRVALLFRNSPHYIVLFYGTLSAGCVAVPLNVQERAVVLARQIEQSGASLLIGDPRHPEWGALRAAVGDLSVDVLEIPVQEGPASQETFLNTLGTSGSAPPMPVLAADQLAAIIYTSGTTGLPKGVMLSHGNLHSNATSIIRYMSLCSSDRALCILPFQFAYGNSVLHSHLLAGVALVLEDNFAFPHETLQRIRDEAITGFSGVPSTFSLLLNRCRLADFDLRLRYITQAGGAMSTALITRLRQDLPETQVFVMYGQTEATARLTYLPPERLDEKLGSVGIPLDDVEIEIRDAGRRAATGVVGEIYARGPNVMLGYWNNPAATAEALHDGWLRTGDLGHLDEDGYLFIHGRSIEMIKTGAFRVSPQEVEEVIAAIDGVEEVAVTAIPDEILGQSVKAVIIRKGGVELAAMAVKAHCRKQLASYKVPKVVEFATALPRTASGKIQRLSL